MKNKKAMFTSLNQKWRTPESFYKLLNKEFRFTHDPCPTRSKFDGLSVKWGKRNYINTPYNQVELWIHKAVLEKKRGSECCVLLVPARTDTKWFHNLVLPHAKEIRFIKGRLKFQGAKNCAPFPSMVVVF